MVTHFPPLSGTLDFESMDCVQRPEEDPLSLPAKLQRELDLSSLGGRQGQNACGP
jgi:hypothetical protein